MTRILLVDDHPIVLDGLKNLLSAEQTFEVVGTAPDGQSALQILSSVRVDLVITDLEMPGMKGAELVQHLRKDYNCRILVLSMHSERSKVEELMELGVDGFLLKDADKSELLFAIQSVLGGKRYFSSGLIEKGYQAASPTAYQRNVELTKREIEVLQLLAEGLSNREIGERLFLSPRTIDSHRTNLMKKLGVNNVVALVRYALREGIVQ